MGDEDKASDRVLTWRVALVGLAGVLLAGAIGAGSSIWTSSLTINAERNDFLRQQRQAAYATLLADHKAYGEAFDDFFQKRVDKKDSTKQLDSVYKVLSNFHQDVDTVHILGSEEMYQATQKLEIIMSSMIDVVQAPTADINNANDPVAEEADQYAIVISLAKQDVQN